jgi:hypothetical protein
MPGVRYIGAESRGPKASVRSLAANVLSTAAIFAASFAPSSLLAHPLYLFGHVGAAPVIMTVERDGDALTGWYFYSDVGKELRLKGSIDASGAFTLEESVDAKTTGEFRGQLAGSRWSGQWRKPDGGTPLAFTANETTETFASSADKIQCSSTHKDKEFGWTYSYALKLGLLRGKVTRFSASTSESSATDGDQGCFYELENFKPAASDAGLLLRARDEDDPLSADSQRCSIRIVGDADYLLVEVGDATQSNDDCRYSGDRAFCSPRSFPADMIVNRKAGTCRPVQ